MRATTAGDDAALYDALLLTLKDAGPVKGRKVVVVFSNGPDNASMVPPEDLDELAQSEGIPVYMISTRDAKIEPMFFEPYAQAQFEILGRSVSLRIFRLRPKLP